MFRNFLAGPELRLWPATAASAAMLCLGLFSAVFATWEAERAVRDHVAAQGQLLAKSLAQGLTQRDPLLTGPGMREAAVAVLGFPNVLEVEITDARQNVLLKLTKSGAVPTAPANPSAAPAPSLQDDRIGLRFTATLPAAPAALAGDAAGGTAAKAAGQATGEAGPAQAPLPAYVHVMLGKGSPSPPGHSLLVDNLLAAGLLTGALLVLLACSGWIVHPPNQGLQNNRAKEQSQDNLANLDNLANPESTGRQDSRNNAQSVPERPAPAAGQGTLDAAPNPASPPLPEVGHPAAEVIDRAVLDRLGEIMGPSLEKALTPFLEDTPSYLTSLEQAVAEGRHEAAREIAQALKGSSGNLGAIQVHRLAKEIEELARNQRLQEAHPLLTPLRAACAAAAQVLEGSRLARGAPDTKPSAAPAEVLVVDDDRSTRSALRYTLERDGFQVREASDGAQALAMLKRMTPDVILMDAVMPVMDGFTACAKVQELPHGRMIPVLMITGLEDKLSVERAFAAGACDYIPKPIHFAVLSQRVRRTIEANQAEKRIRHLAYNDLLTGLPNRTMFFEQLALQIEQARANVGSLAVLFLDLDRFKYVNDNLGHDVGDRLLVAVAQRVRRSVRSVDCVARLGADEFAVVLSEIDSPGAAASAAQNISRTLATAFQIDGNDIFVTSSVGIALYPHDGSDPGALVKHAGAAMHRAKKTNTGFQFFEASMEHSISEHVRLESDLRRALENNELEVHYQPQTDIKHGGIIGMEALVRWPHPTRGQVSPVEFIPIAEETGLINPLGDWVLRTACAQLRDWLAAGLPQMRVAVNLSVRQLLQKDFAISVELALEDTGLPPHLLELEITESTLMEHAQETLQALHRLRDLGVRLSIDDFGTGYSSLSYLKRFPVDIVKIDRSFVRDVPQDADDSAIVTGIIALAHSLRLEVVAEGVETEAQLGFLRKNGCDLMQGYYTSPALPPEQFAQFVLGARQAELDAVPALAPA